LESATLTVSFRGEIRELFITSYGRYVSREEAAKIAVNAKQVRPIIAVLMSEDLWFAELGGQFDYDYIKGYY
jgi:hypothetical protein